MVHGRFQPFHNGHLECLQQASTRCRRLLIGITNPDRHSLIAEPGDPSRHLPASNPFTFTERLLMITAVLRDTPLRVPSYVIPFPINSPEVWNDYVPSGHRDWSSQEPALRRSASITIPRSSPGSKSRSSRRGPIWCSSDWASPSRNGSSWPCTTGCPRHGGWDVGRRSPSPPVRPPGARLDGSSGSRVAVPPGARAAAPSAPLPAGGFPLRTRTPDPGRLLRVGASSAASACARRARAGCRSQSASDLTPSSTRAATRPVRLRIRSISAGDSRPR